MTATPRILVLLGDKVGDNNQVLALAEGLGLPFETRTLRYNLLRAIPPRYLGGTLTTLTADSRRWMREPWPDLILAIGRRSVPVARWIRARSPRTKLVLVGHPRVNPRHFNLVITTRQYPVPRHDNVVLLPMSMSRLRDPGEASADERTFLEPLPRPHLLFAIGGPTKYWSLDEAAIQLGLNSALRRAEFAGGSVIAVTSRRTPREVTALVRSALSGTHHRLVDGPSPRFSLLMADADEIFVTADSISMLSEAIQTGKPVGMVPITLSAKGRKRLGPEGKPEKGRARSRRDLRRIWDRLQADGVVGTVDKPSASSALGQPVHEAVASVLNLLG